MKSYIDIDIEIKGERAFGYFGFRKCFGRCPDHLLCNYCSQDRKIRRYR